MSNDQNKAKFKLPKRKIDFPTLKRLLGMLFKRYPKRMTAAIICMVFSAITAASPAIFQQKIIADIQVWYMTGDWAAASQVIIPKVLILIGLYLASLGCVTAHTQLIARVTQGFLASVREEMFNKMQNLPIKYFDTKKHGDIMAHFTNDIDVMREIISASLPDFIKAGVIVLSVFFIMLYYSFLLTAIVIVAVIAMLFASGKIGGGAGAYFLAQQKTFGKMEGFVQEMMNGQKVVKVFNHEEKAIKDFDDVYAPVFQNGFRANAFANTLGPIIANIGNVLYVVLATLGGALLLREVGNFGLATLMFGTFAKLTIDVVVPFLNMTKQFTGNINNVSQQINSIVQGLAGAKRLFDLMDELPEVDNGYVTLVNCTVDKDGNITETNKRTNQWAWKHPHGDGTLTYSLLKGDIYMENVDFAYVEGKPVLQDISLYAKPGQKVAFVGATGAGKTTITNLINRFYDIEDGKIRYDGININKIKKSDLRRSLGLVLQDTSLFTGTVMENIRYGRLDATDKECIEAAKLAGAHDFITRLPKGYNSELANNGSNLSQGQRQLLAIARAAVANCPVLILDEATSSIDTRTEQIVQEGMDKLMNGRTTFVIAHRLSTVMSADVIMVLDHGKIIERGTHKQLIDQKGIYYQLYTGAFELE